jgi:HSP20 family protein
MLLDHVDPFFAELDRMSKQVLGGGDGTGMPMDISRCGDELVLRADLPGVAVDAIDVTIEGRVLTVTARRERGFGEGEQVLLQERLEGTVTRRLRLPDWIDGGHVAAEHVDGVLTLRLPLAEQAKPRRVTIRGGNDATSIAATPTATTTAETAA